MTNESTVTLTLTLAQSEALASLLDDYVNAHTDTGYDPPYNGDPDLITIRFETARYETN